MTVVLTFCFTKHLAGSFHLGPVLPSDDGEVSFPVTEEEMSLFNYKSLVTDWPDEGGEQAIERISQGDRAHQILMFFCSDAVVVVVVVDFE